MSKTISLRGAAAEAFMNAAQANRGAKILTADQEYESVAVFVAMCVKQGTKRSMLDAVPRVLKALRDSGPTTALVETAK